MVQTGTLSTHVQGSCRMGSDRERSAVNAHGESHDIRRLFIGDSSVVPRTLSVNPSLTIMALASRLAEYPGRRPARLHAQRRPSPSRGRMTPLLSVRDATFDVMRARGMTRIFGNPGSTEVSFLTDLPPDIDFVMGLHEGAVVGMATGYALATGEPQFVNLHCAGAGERRQCDRQCSRLPRAARDRRRAAGP